MIVGLGGGLSALAAVLIVALIHLYAGSLLPHNTAYATPTLAPTHPLVWKKVPIPADFANPKNTAFMALAPSDPIPPMSA